MKTGGIYIHDTYGPMAEVDQLCECRNVTGLRVGDTLVLDTDMGDFPFAIALIESYLDESGHPNDVTGVGLVGPCSELVMPGDTLQIGDKPAVAAAVTITALCVMVDETQHIEVHSQVAAA